MLRRKAILDNSEFILDLQEDQIRKGVSSEDKLFPSYISEEYALFKQSLSSYLAPPPTPDLYLTGDFLGAKYLEIQGQDVLIDSTDSKSPALKKKYKPFGLIPFNQERAKGAVTNQYIKEVYNVISA